MAGETPPFRVVVRVEFEATLCREQCRDLGVGEDRDPGISTRGTTASLTGFVGISSASGDLEHHPEQGEWFFISLQRQSGRRRTGDVCDDSGDVGVTEERDQPGGGDRAVIGDGRRLRFHPGGSPSGTFRRTRQRNAAWSAPLLPVDMLQALPEPRCAFASFHRGPAPGAPTLTPVVTGTESNSAISSAVRSRLLTPLGVVGEGYRRGKCTAAERAAARRDGRQHRLGCCHARGSLPHGHSQAITRPPGAISLGVFPLINSFFPILYFIFFFPPRQYFLFFPLSLFLNLCTGRRRRAPR